MKPSQPFGSDDAAHNPTVPPVTPSASQPITNPPAEQPAPPNPITPPSVRPQVVRPSGVGWLRPAAPGSGGRRKKLFMLTAAVVVSAIAVGGYFLFPIYLQRQNSQTAARTADTFMDGLIAGDYERVTSVYSGRDLKRDEVEISKSDNIEKSPRLGLDVRTKGKPYRAVATYKLTLKSSGASTAYIVVLLEKDSGHWKVKNLVPSFAVEPKADVDSYSTANFTGDSPSGNPPTSQSKSKHDIERETDIKALHGQLEAYYAQNGRYPTRAQLNDSAFRTANVKGLDESTLKDPAGSAKSLSDKPAKNVYAYQVTSDAGASCNNQDKDCTAYTLTATKDDGTTFSKKALN